MKYLTKLPNPFSKLNKRYKETGVSITLLWSLVKFYGLITDSPLLYFCKINDFIFIGGSYGKPGKKILQRNGIKHSINLQEEADDAILHLALEGRHLYLPTKDEHAISPSNLIRGIEFIDRCRGQKEPVYVHCKSGVGRAPTLVMAYFMVKEQLNFQKSHLKVKLGRPFVLISDRQRQQLLSLEKEDYQ